MSSAGEGSREWRFYVADMIEFADKVRTYTSGMDQATFIDDAVTYDATLRNLELIGEAATHIPIGIRDEHPEVPWRTIIAARNRLAHSYLSVDDDLIWNISRKTSRNCCARCASCWIQPCPDQRRADGKDKPRKSPYSKPSSRMPDTNSIFGDPNTRTERRASDTGVMAHRFPETQGCAK